MVFNKLETTCVGTSDSESRVNKTGNYLEDPSIVTVNDSYDCKLWTSINKYTFNFLSFPVPNHSTVTVNFCLSVNIRKWFLRGTI